MSRRLAWFGDQVLPIYEEIISGHQEICPFELGRLVLNIIAKSELLTPTASLALNFRLATSLRVEKRETR